MQRLNFFSSVFFAGLVLTAFELAFKGKVTSLCISERCQSLADFTAIETTNMQ